MESKVTFIDTNLREAFESLEKSDTRLFKEISSALNIIKQNVFCGRHVKKKLIPKELAHKYNIKNLWIYNLRKDWRLLYSIADDEIEVLALILNWMDHKDYERLFNF